ncbi:MAG: hypothetical protein K5655_02995 [Lachnospiraceae bacterium]|nr:hypothetical protein [Lachnospiraceae bacterium]
MVMRRWGSEDKMEDIVRIDNSPYAVYRKCYYEVRKFIEAVPQEKLFMEITDDLKAVIYVGKEYVDALYEVLKMDYLMKYTLEEKCYSDAEYPESVKQNIDYVLSYLAYYDFSGHSVDHDIESDPFEKAVVDAFDDLGRIIAIDYIFK